MAHSLLTVPVPELDGVVRRRLQQGSPEYLPVSTDDTAAHVTLLAPFTAVDELTEGVLSELSWFFADVTPFAFSLTRVSRFPGGTVYLTPDPASPFRQLTLELARRFPEHPPYGGAFAEVVPHLSVPLLSGEDAADVERELSAGLPVAAHAREAALYWWEPGACRTLESFTFGTAAA